MEIKWIAVAPSASRLASHSGGSGRGEVPRALERGPRHATPAVQRCSGSCSGRRPAQGAGEGRGGNAEGPRQFPANDGRGRSSLRPPRERSTCRPRRRRRARRLSFHRTNKYLQKSSITRVCAVGGFFVSIPVFLTGIILYTFIQFHSTPAIVTSVFIGLGIIFCGCAMVHNVFVWQREKTNAVRALAQQQQQVMRQPTPPTPTELNKSACHPREASGSVSPGMPPATLDLSSVTTATAPHELSTLV
ncbi:Uncharacterized protein GBIM_11221 [Gryllus bimaculatus]|nr:Uncharacterized protein GBIM_11221 [Gryllus bimaculatus]